MSHDCDNKNCEGKVLAGLHWNCNKCGKKSFCDCTAKENDEAFCLLVAMKLINENADGEATTNVNSQTLKDFNLIFGDNSLFGFTCKSCKTKDVIEVDAKQEQINQLKSQLQVEHETAIELKKKNDALEETIEENKKLIRELTEENSNPFNVTDNGITNKIIGNDSTSLEEIKTQIMSDMKALMSCEIGKLDKKFAKETKTTREFCTKKINERESNKNSGIRSAFDNLQSDTPKRSVSFASAKGNQPKHDQVADNQQRNDSHLVFSEKMKPATQTKTTDKNRYEIYVAKFAVGTTVSDIVEHVMKNTSIINPEAFKVEICNSNSDYIAFKVSTLNKEPYDEIMNIWSPYYVASKYRYVDTHRSKINPFRMKNGFDTPMHSNRRNSNTNTNTRTMRRYSPRRNERRERNERSNNNNNTPNRHRDHRNEAHRTPQQTKSQPIQPQYIMIPYQQPMSQTIPPHFFGQQMAQHPIQQYQRQHQQQQQQNVPTQM